MIDRGRVHLEGDNVSAPVLCTNISDLRAGPGDEVVYSAGKAERAPITRAEMLDHRDFCQFISDQKQVRKYGYIFAA